MNWFDTSGLAELAKNALKEAQKTIDKALDINEEEGTISTTTTTNTNDNCDTTTSADNYRVSQNKKCNTEPTTPISQPPWCSSSSAAATINVDSNDHKKMVTQRRNNSFTTTDDIHYQKQHQMIVKPPKKCNLDISSSIKRNQSSADVYSPSSDSIEILSSPNTPHSSSGITIASLSASSSSSGVTACNNSESIDVITSNTTATTSNDDIMYSPVSIKSPDSIEIIGKDEILLEADDNDDDDDDDTTALQSYNNSSSNHTVIDGSTGNIVITNPPSITNNSGMVGAIGGSGVTDSCDSIETLTDVVMKMTQASSLSTSQQTDSIGIPVNAITSYLSDSTHSGFEDIQILDDNASSIEEKEDDMVKIGNSTSSKSSSKNQNQNNNTMENNNTGNNNRSGTTSSGHTSADEIETTTSSDIEIISNLNGADSSSTNSICHMTPIKCTMIVNSDSKQRNKKTIIAVTSTSTGDDNGSGTSKLQHYKTTTTSTSSSSSAAACLLKKGHHRELSEISIQSDDSISQLSNNSLSDIDKLLHRISELSELLESRDLQLCEMNKKYCELNDKYLQLKSNELNKDHSEYTTNDEYTQHLSALEKKFQLSLRENDSLRSQLQMAINELRMKNIHNDDYDRMQKDKDNIINELRLEGDALSKQILQKSNIIKKLRTKENETNNIIRQNNEQIQQLNDEVDRLKKSLIAKENIECTQIEHIHKITDENKKLNKENNYLKNQLDDLNIKNQLLQKNFDLIKTELCDKNKIQKEYEKQKEILIKFECEKTEIQMKNNELLKQIDDLRLKLQLEQNENLNSQQKLRKNNTDLLKRLELSEIRSEELMQEISLSTIPLVKQLNQMQETLKLRTNNWEKQEKELLDKLETTEEKLKILEKIESASKDKELLLNQQIRKLEERLSNELIKSERSDSALQQAKLEFTLKENDYQRQITELQRKFDDLMKKFNDIQTIKTVNQPQNECKNEQDDEPLNYDDKQNYKINENKIPQTITQQHQKQQEQQQMHVNNDDGNSGNKQQQQQENLPLLTSSSFTTRRNSLAESSGESSAWQMDDLDVISNTGRLNDSYMIGSSSYNNCTSSTGGNFNQLLLSHNSMAPTTFDCLQSSLKQRDGEINQLHWELSRLQIERDVLNEEITNLTLQIENLKEKLIMHDAIEKEYTELQRKYDALLQMYGEKVEEHQELELDLQDIKEMYRTQINELLKQQNLKDKSQSTEQSITPISTTTQLRPTTTTTLLSAPTEL